MSKDEKELATGESSAADQNPDNPSKPYKPIRIWPPVLLLVGMILLRYLPNMIEDGPSALWMAPAFGPALCGLLILFWWVCASRARWFERVIGAFSLIGLLVVAVALCDKSMLGPGTTMLTLPMGMAAFVVGLIFTIQTLSFKRTVVALLMAALGFGFSALVRYEGSWGDFAPAYQWRFVPTLEQEMLAAKSNSGPSIELTDVVADVESAFVDPEWPEFRGPNRNGVQSGTRISTDWKTNPPELVWKVAVGPGWSSFIVAGNVLFTQEQRGENECVVCYSAADGKEVWVQQLKSRFEEPLGGPGPRSTPTLHDGSLYTMGGGGHLFKLDPATGNVVWQTDVRTVTERTDFPMWGFSSSPLVYDKTVVVYGAGKGDKGTLAFDTETGDLKWSVAAGVQSYASHQICEINGEKLVGLLTEEGMDLLDPTSGKPKLKYQWKHEGYRALQPYALGGDSFLIPTGLGSGTRRVQFSGGEELSGEEMWTSRNLKADFSDLVVFEGHIYGFDNTIFTCLDLETGQRKWKGGRYGKGQAILLEDSGVILVISEKGTLFAVKAAPESHQELAKLDALEGKTWNHPVVVGDRLYVRNAQEAACFRLPTVSGISETPPGSGAEAK